MIRGKPGPGFVGRGLIASVRWYRDAVSPALPARCRFYPTCSAYAVTALQRYGPVRGGWLALRRILKCAPWHPGGVDLVPERVASEPGDPASTAGSGPVRPAKNVGPQQRPVSQESAVA